MPICALYQVLDALFFAPFCTFWDSLLIATMLNQVDLIDFQARQKRGSSCGESDGCPIEMSVYINLQRFSRSEV